MRTCVAVLVLAACKQADSPKPQVAPVAPAAPAAAPADAPRPACEQLPFSESTPVAEASGAAWLDHDGRPALLVVGDSGHDGAYVIVDAETGETREQGRLPLGTEGGDDIEGLAARGDRFHGLTSDGWMRVWKRAAKGFELVDTYRLDASGAFNYEGLALAPEPRNGCAGFACSKATGEIFCLTEQRGRHAVDAAKKISVSPPKGLGDCAFSADGTLFISNNIFAMGGAFRVEDWHDASAANVVRVDVPTLGNPEVIAAHDDLVYRMSDMGGAPSLMAKFRCGANGR